MENQKKVLFVCSGNTCRSPMAEAFMKYYLVDMDAGTLAEVESAGVAPSSNSPASPETISVMLEVGIDVREHVARKISEELVRNAVRVYALAPNHYKALVEAFPEEADKFFLLGDGVIDPFGQSVDVYRRTRDQIDGLVKEETIKLISDLSGKGV